MAQFGKGVQNQLIASIIVSLGAMTIGTIIGRWWTPDIIANYTTDGKDSPMLTTCISATIGALLYGVFSNLYGHRKRIVLGEVSVIIGWTLIYQFSNGEAGFEIGCLLQGLGIGVISSTVPVYIGEISQSHIRGLLGVLFYVHFIMGLLYTYVLASFTDNLKVINILCLIWPVIHVIGVFFIPESPYVHLKNNKTEEATASITKLRDDNTVTQELSVIQTEIEQQMYEQNTIWKILTNRANIKAMLIGLYTFVILSIVDIKIIMVQMAYVCKECSWKHNLTMIFLVVQLMMAFITMAIIDKAGRKVLLVVSGIVMALSSIALLCYFHFLKESNTTLLVVIIAAYILGFSLGFGPVPWVLLGEIFPTRVTILGPCIINAIFWFIMSMQAIKHSTGIEKKNKTIDSEILFIAQSVLWFLSSLFAWFMVPETKNKSLIQIKMMLTGNDGTSTANVV